MKLILKNFDTRNPEKSRIVFTGNLEPSGTINENSEIHASKALNLVLLNFSGPDEISNDLSEENLTINAVIINNLSSHYNISESSVKAVAELSPREFEVLEDLVNDYTYLEISTRRFIDLETVKSHATHIYTKLGVTCKAKAKLAYFAYIVTQSCPCPLPHDPISREA